MESRDRFEMQIPGFMSTLPWLPLIVASNV